MGVGLRLKEILRNKQMTIKQLSEKTGISINTLYSITKRDSERVDAIILNQLSQTLDIPTAYLLGLTDDPNDESFSAAVVDFFVDSRARRAEELRKSAQHRQLMSRQKLDQMISTAEKEHIDYLRKLCFDPRVIADDYPGRIRYITSFIQKNEEVLKLAMPGMNMLPDDIAEAERIRKDDSMPTPCPDEEQ